MKIKEHQVCDELRDAALLGHGVTVDGSAAALVAVDNGDMAEGVWKSGDVLEAGVLYSLSYNVVGIDVSDALPVAAGRVRALGSEVMVLFMVEEAGNFALTLPEGGRLLLTHGASSASDIVAEAGEYLLTLRLMAGSWWAWIERSVSNS